MILIIETPLLPSSIYRITDRVNGRDFAGVISRSSGACAPLRVDTRQFDVLRWKRGPQASGIMRFYQAHIVPLLVNLAMRNRLLRPYRERILGFAEGRILEIGVGSGLNLPLYANRTTEVLGLEPHPKLLHMAAQKPHWAPVKLIEGSAEAIPLASGSVDTVVTTWTLCSVPDVAAALAEMRRVLKPDGRLLLVEHGLAPDEKVRKWQHRLTPAWRRFAGGCHLDRPMADLVNSAGFHLDHLQTGYMQGPKPMTFIYEGIASPVWPAEFSATVW